ncbi:MAG: VapC toxin family PIN domain ribonuclease, partial [Deltaproteobacteria bacterium]|nr:VapC toxin family PIN domain ribonuclease [Deltaproteobacteria bacterium]
MTTYLLDVNLLLALSDPMHIHHELAHRWFAEKGHQAWATCPLTENGFIRIASHPNYPNRPGD